MRSATAIAILLAAAGVLPGGRLGKNSTKPAQASPQATRPARALPAGFVPVKASPIHPSGYPKEIRCLKDGSVMVFVPGGEFISGLTEQQFDELLELRARLEDPPAGKPAATWEAAALGQLEASVALGLRLSKLQPLKPGKLVTEEDLRHLETLRKQEKLLSARFDELDAAGKPIPRKDLERWAGGASQMLAVLCLGELQAEGKQIPPAELDQWRKGGMTLPELFKLPAVRRAAGITEEQYKRLLMTPKQLAEEELEQRRSYLKSRIRASQKARLGPFYIDKYEVTNRQYRLFMAEEKDKTHAPGIRYNTDGYNIYALGEWKFYDLWKDKRRSHDDQPVTCVSEGDAIAYARWAGRSLPSQLHWERAAVGEGGRLFPWGSDFKPGDCRCRVRTARPAAKSSLRQEVKELREAFAGEVPSAVGKFPRDRSPFGCYDMGGNVSEWVEAPPKELFGRPRYALMGGSAGCYSLEGLVPALKGSSIGSPKLAGFRTVLLLGRAGRRAEG